MKKLWKVLVPLMLAVALTLGLAACETGGGKAAAGKALAGYVSININPSIEFITDANGKVVRVRAANADAQVLLSDMNLVGLTVEEATKQVTQAAEQAGYLNESNKKVTVLAAGETDAATAELTQQAQDGAAQGSDLATVTDTSKAWGREVEKLKAQDPVLYADMTPAKLKLIYAIADYDAKFTVEQGAAMKVKVLKELLEDYAEEFEDMVTDELEDKYDALYAQKTAEINRLIDAVYGEEYAGKAEILRTLEQKEEQYEKQLENAVLSDQDVAALVAALGLENSDALKDAAGAVTVKSAEAYLEKVEDAWDEEDGADDDAMEELLDGAEELLEKYDEDEAALTEDMRTELKALLGEDMTIANLDELEEYAETLEDELEEMRDGITLTDEQKAQIKTLKAQKKEIKQQVKQELKDEIVAAKQALKEEKQARKQK